MTSPRVAEVFDAVTLLREASQRHGLHLSVFVAETSLWAHPNVHRTLMAENGTGAFFVNTRRCRAGDGERPSAVIDGVRLDNNSYANHAIKQALGLGRNGAIGFETCHIWPRTCYDARYHTAVANLVLLPRPLAGLTDHDAEIRAALQYRAFDLYDWHPADEPPPVRPAFYPESWRPPLPFSPVVRRALARRRAVISSDAVAQIDD